VSRRFRQPRLLEVEVDAAGQPAWLRWRGRRERARVCNTWQVEGAWWQGQPVARTYFTLLTASRAALVVYRDEAARRWFLEGILD
jgi:hypothetical protein